MQLRGSILLLCECKAVPREYKNEIRNFQYTYFGAPSIKDSNSLSLGVGIGIFVFRKHPLSDSEEKQWHKRKSRVMWRKNKRIYSPVPWQPSFFTTINYLLQTLWLRNLFLNLTSMYVMPGKTKKKVLPLHLQLWLYSLPTSTRYCCMP